MLKGTAAINIPFFTLITNIMRSMPLRFRVECLWNILFKKCGISNQPVTASAMIRVFPSLEHSTDCVRKPTDNFRTFVCPLWHQWTKHNRAKPMSELASALFSIADANEFRFARFYIVCEAVPLGTLESPLIVCGLSDTLRESPNVEETRNQMQSSGWKKYTHFSPTNVSYAVPPEICIMRFL